MKFSLYLACLAMAAAFSASDLSPPLSKYFCIYNGLYTNIEFLKQNPDSGFPKVELRVSSVYIPNISKNPMTYVEQSDNDQVVLAEIGEVNVESNGDISVKPSNFTDYSGKKPGEININDYTNLTRDQLRENPGCDGSLQLIDDTRFFGDLPDCRHVSNTGLRGVYSASLTCDTISVNVPNGSAESQTGGGLTLKLQGDKFPMPDGSACTCPNTSS